MVPTVTSSLKSKKVDSVLIPGGCTKYIQVPDVSWNKPFKALCTEKYDMWLENEGINQETECGNLKPPPRRTIVEWILSAWNDLCSDTIRKSFKACALTSALNCEKDGEIHCLKPNQPCHAGLAMLKDQMEMFNETEDNPFTPSCDEITDAAPLDIIVDEDEEEDEDINVDD